MGRNTTTPDPQQLTRFAIGEIQDFSGVPDFLDSGTSKWLRSDTQIPSSSLRDSTKSRMQASGIPSAQAVTFESPLSATFRSRGLFVANPIARIPASNISVVPALVAEVTLLGVGVFNSEGVRFVFTPLFANTPSTSTRIRGVIVSDDTTITGYTVINATQIRRATTTNGTTWSQTALLTGLPVFAFDTATAAFGGTLPGTENTNLGWKREKGTGGRNFAVFFCGARYLLIGHDGANYIATQSVDGLNFNGDATSIVIGSTQGRGEEMTFHRNGNNCYLQINNIRRFSTNGGITWANSTLTNGVNFNIKDRFQLENRTDPAKLIFIQGNNSVATYTTNTGASLTQRNLTGTPRSVVYRGSTVVSCSTANILKVSTDDGVSFTDIVLPIGVLGTEFTVLADESRFYICVRGQAQILTSTDGVNYVLRTLPQVCFDNFHMGITSYDTNNVMINVTGPGGGQALFTKDGGVTWIGARLNATSEGSFAAGNAYVTPDAGEAGFVIPRGNFLSDSNVTALKQDLLSEGALYRTPNGIVTPSRTNAIAFVRVE